MAGRQGRPREGPGWRGRGLARGGVAVVALAGALGLGWWFPHAGTWLVAEDAFARADMALVLSGGEIPRTLAARDLYRQGRVARIVVIPEPPPPYADELIRLGLQARDQPSWSERILVASGVPRERVSVFPHPINGTIHEALELRRFLSDRGISSVVLVTSRLSSRRARFIFRRVLKPTPMIVWSFPTPYDGSTAERWWSQPRSALHVVTEYEKFLVNAMTLTLGLHERRPLPPKSSLEISP